MKIKRLNMIIILSTLLVVQILLIVFLNVFSTQRIKTRSIEKKLLKGYSKGSVEFIEIIDYQDAFSIEKKDGSWVINIGEKAIPGDVTKIGSYLGLLQNLTQGIIIDKGTDLTSDAFYGFDKEGTQKIVVRMKSKKEFAIQIGNIGSKRGSSYIRLNEEKKVREIKSFIAKETSNQPIQWAKKEIFDDVIVEDIEKCEIDSLTDWFKGKYTIQYKEQEDEKKENFELIPPIIIEGMKLKDYALHNILSNIVDLRIDDYKFDGDISSNVKAASIKLTLKNESTFMLDIYKAGESDAGDFIADVDFNNYLYFIKESDVKRFVKTQDELVEKAGK